MAKLTFRPGEDRIIDLCGGEPEGPATPPQEPQLRDLFAGQIQPDTSWLLYQNYVTVEAETGTVPVQRLPKKEVQDAKTGGLTAELRAANFPGNPASPPPPPPVGRQADVFLPAGIDTSRAVGGRAANLLQLLREFARQEADAGFGPVAGGQSGDAGTPKADQAPGAQRRAEPACYVVMHGRALRAGFPIPCPELTEVEDMKKGDGLWCVNRTDRGEGFTTGIVGNAVVPVFGARWRLRYYLKKVPKGPVAPPRNPILEHR